MKERDFTSLEDQIRCLKKRFEQLQANEVTSICEDHMKGDEEEAFKEELAEQSREIDKLKEILEELRSKIKAKKRQHETLKEHYV